MNEGTLPRLEVTVMALQSQESRALISHVNNDDCATVQISELSIHHVIASGLESSPSKTAHFA